ncbi:hypothetical protein ACFV1L_23565 [Kitasatospora sp. NPDC059646]|uniref:hypothetical protein n=1 Tax=Kitasatospora sp. NPDC059646 TaxID=3346893 RepID=UPI00369274D0
MRGGRLLAGAVLSAVAASGAAACTSPSTGDTAASAAPPPSATASETPLENLPVEEVIARARVAGNTLTSLTITLSLPEYREGAVTGTFSQDSSGSCAGRYAVAGKGTTEVVRSGGKVWWKPDASALRASAPDLPASEVGKWFGGSESTTKTFASAFCNMGTALATQVGLNTDGSLGKDLAVAGTRQLDGRKVVVVTMTDENGVPVSYFIAAEGRPYLLSTESGGGKMAVQLGDFGKPVDATPPPDDQVARR